MMGIAVVSGNQIKYISRWTGVNMKILYYMNDEYVVDISMGKGIPYPPVHFIISMHNI